MLILFSFSDVSFLCGNVEVTELGVAATNSPIYGFEF
jgi:hypothetical protein